MMGADPSVGAVGTRLRARPFCFSAFSAAFCNGLEGGKRQAKQQVRSLLVSCPLRRGCRVGWFFSRNWGASYQAGPECASHAKERGIP